MKQEYPEKKKVDVIGDLHGCFEELKALLTKLGYKEGKDQLWTHPEGRTLAFVGDLTDRGPQNEKCLLFARNHVEAGLATVSKGNHDDKLGRSLKGNPVKVGHGLDLTLKELEGWSSEKKKDWSQWLLDLPLAVTFDEGRLLVSHAAAPPKDASSKKTKAVCLYGHTTGAKDENGFPLRLDWVPEYNQQASEDDPLVVWGHVTHQEPYVTEKAVCVDTCCFGGNKLTAFRYPERELVSVPSLQPNEERDLAEGGESSDLLRGVKSDPITDMSLPYLLGELREREEDLLYLIDTDEYLNKRTRKQDGLVIANASKALFEPEKEHQLLAKGIVYKRDPYRLVSLALAKMHNHGMRDFSDQVSRRYEEMSDTQMAFVEKMDGTMVQVFEHEGDIVFTTRSVMEGVETKYFDSGSFPYIEEARALAEEKYPQIMDPSFVENKSLVFEFIHPQARVVTDYGDLKQLTLLSVFDHEDYTYWPSQKVCAFAENNELDCFDVFLYSNCLESGVKKVRRNLKGRDDLPEGAIVNFEKGGEVVHRVKVKTMDYLKYHRLKFQCTYKTVVEMIWNKPPFWDWDAFNQHLQQNHLTEEEVESYYREFFDQFMMYLKGVKEIRDQAISVVEEFNASYESSKEADEGAYYKALAFLCREEHRDLMHHIMTYAREGEVDLQDVMWNRPPCKGFKAIVTRWKQGNEKVTIDTSFEDLILT